MIQVAVTIHTHSPILTPFLQPLFFFFIFYLPAEISTHPKKEDEKCGGNAGDELLGMSLAHREPNTQALYVAV